MKKLLLTLAFVSSALAFGQTVSNLTFDTGILNWSGTSSTIAWDNTLDATGNGGGSLKISTSSAAGRAQTSGAPASNGAGNYDFSCKVYGTAGTVVQLQPQQSGAGFTATSYTIVNSNTWETVPVTTYNVTNTTANINLRIIGQASGVTFNVDDVKWALQIPADAAFLNATASGPGTVAKSPNTAFYTGGDNVTVTATPTSHCLFNGWSGDLTGTTNPSTVAMVASTTKNVTGNFIVDPTFNYVFNFNNAPDMEGWGTTTDVTKFVATQSGGLVTLTPTAGQFARFSLTNFPIPAADFNKLTIVMQNTSATTDQMAVVVFNGTTTTFVNNTITTSDTGLKTYTFTLDPAIYTAWTGTITDLRLKFANVAAATGKPVDASPIIIDSIAFSYDPTLSTSDVSKAKNLLQVYVSENTLNFRNANVSKATIFSMNGQLVKDAKVQNNAVDVSNLKAGVYMVKTVAQDNTETVTKFIKK